jgi:sn-glycerol 3-phosphate transport system ATP-binding protein
LEAQEMLGAERLLYLRLGDESIIVRVDEALPVPDLGTEVQVTPRADRLHWFDAETGLRCADPT